MCGVHLLVKMVSFVDKAEEETIIFIHLLV